MITVKYNENGSEVLIEKTSHDFLVMKRDNDQLNVLPQLLYRKERGITRKKHNIQ